MIDQPHRQFTDLTNDTSRRHFLRALTATSATLGFAGCLGDDTDSQQANGVATEPDEDDGTDDRDEESTDRSVPDDFTDREQLRERSLEYLELLETGAFETAAAWSDPEVAGKLDAPTLRAAWNGTVGESATRDTVRTVAYLGTEAGNNTYVIWATYDEEPYELTLSYSEEGVVLLNFQPVGGWTPPEYADEDAFEEQAFTLETPLDCDLGSILALPSDGGPHPGVVLVHGNGPQDRDATAGPNRPFRELAWGLASQGIAVLRYDKRTFACDVDVANATVDDIVTDDALTALERLRDHDRVDPRRVFVAGFSFGGLLAPRIAKRDGDVAGSIMLAPGPARPFGETIVEQTAHVLELQGVRGEEKEEVLEAVRAEATQLDELDIRDDEVIRYGGREYHESLQEYDQTTTAAALEVPQQLLQGGQDWQITVEDDLPIWREALEDSPSADITVYDDLNHLFQESSGVRTPAEYVQPDNPVDRRVIEDIASFVRRTTGEAASGESESVQYRQSPFPALISGML